MATIQFAHIGMNNIVQTNRVLVIIPPKTITANRILETAKGRGQFIDCSRGRSHRAILILDDGTVLASTKTPMTLLRRFTLNEDQLPTDFREDDAEELLEFDGEDEEGLE
jgi:regulator of extracellular matrix RemA (YlzA/DUF370 family)